MLTNILDYLRVALYGVLLAIMLMIFQNWNKEHSPTLLPEKTTSIEVAADKIGYIPQVANNTAATTKTSTPITATASSQLIHVKTDVIEADIDPVGGNIVQLKLLRYAQETNKELPVLLLNNNDKTRYLAQSGLLSTSGPDTNKGQATYTVEQADYTLGQDQAALEVKLHWQNAQGIKVTKTYQFHRDNYDVDLIYKIENSAQQPWEGNLYLQLMRADTPPQSNQGWVSFGTYFGAAISSPEKKFQKVTFKEMGVSNLDQTITGGWAAMIQHYFVSAWVPEKTATARYFSHKTSDGLYVIGMLGPKLSVSPGETVLTQAKFYSGPSLTDKLQQTAPGLQLTIDYGWLWFISAILFWLMQKIYDVVGNWGWSIVIVTLVIKLMFYHLSAKSYRSMSALKNLQPRINTLKERYGDDKQKFTQATLELYKKEKVNPMSGCLPILVQIPVFIGLYWVLIESVQLRQAPFMLWIHDLSIKDPFYVLPVLVGISMFLQQRLNPPPPDPMQAKIMALMPVFFTVMFINFPSGLMLYWLVNNLLSYLQQWLIMHRLVKAEKKKHK